MIRIAGKTFPLLLGIGLLLIGIGLQGTLLSLRANLEGFPVPVTGLVMSAYFMGFIIGTFVCPMLIQRVGHIRAFSALAAIAAASAIAHGMWITPWAWLLLRIITGICLVGLYMVIESWLNVMAPNEQRGRFFAVYSMVTLLAMALGQYLILVDSISGHMLFSITGLLVALAVVPVALTRITQPAPIETPHTGGLLALYRESPLGVVGVLVTGLNNGAFWGLGALFAWRIGMDETMIALFMSATIVGGVLLQWPIGHLSDRYDRRRVLMLVVLAAMLIALLAYLLAGISHVLLITVFAAYGGFAFTLYGMSVAHVNDHLSTDRVLDASRKLLLIYGAGAVAGPIIASLVMQLLGPGSLLLYFAMTLLPLFLFARHRLRYAEQIPEQDQHTFTPMVRTSPVLLELDPRLEGNGEEEKSSPPASGF